MSSYSESLRDPKWQKRRLEILSAADWACEDCGRRDQAFEIHHNFYIRAFRYQPWRYERDLLMALCEGCHEIRQNLEEALFVAIARRLRRISIADLEAYAWDQIYDEVKLATENRATEPPTPPGDYRAPYKD